MFIIRYIKYTRPIKSIDLLKAKKPPLRGFLAVRTGLEPVTSCVTGRHSNQAELTHLGAERKAVRTGLEPVTSCVTGRHSNQAELTHLVIIFLVSGCKGSKLF